MAKKQSPTTIKKGVRAAKDAATEREERAATKHNRIVEDELRMFKALGVEVKRHE